MFAIYFVCVFHKHSYFLFVRAKNDLQSAENSRLNDQVNQLTNYIGKLEGTNQSLELKTGDLRKKQEQVNLFFNFTLHTDKKMQMSNIFLFPYFSINFESPFGMFYENSLKLILFIFQKGKKKVHKVHDRKKNSPQKNRPR